AEGAASARPAAWVPERPGDADRRAGRLGVPRLAVSGPRVSRVRVSRVLRLGRTRGRVAAPGLVRAGAVRRRRRRGRCRRGARLAGGPAVVAGYRPPVASRGGLGYAHLAGVPEPRAGPGQAGGAARLGPA